MKFDEITVLLGEFGKYQRRLYILACVPAIFTAMQMLSSVFTLAIPDHRCQLPGLDNDTYSPSGEGHRVQINRSIPLVDDDDDDGSSYSSCDLYSPDNHTVYGQDGVPRNASTRQCSSWVYDISVFRSTFISEENLVCGHDLARANANMILMGGVLVGAIVMGVFADIFGRKTALMVSVFLHLGGAFGSAFAPNYASFVALRFIVGMSNMGIFMSCFVIGVELVGPSKRAIAGIVIEFFWVIGLFVLNIVAYFLRDWNMLQLAIACPAVVLLMYFWLIPESPRWLISRGKVEQASTILEKCAEVNGVKLPDTLLDRDTLDTGPTQSVLKMFTSPRLLMRTLIIYLNWCVVSMVYYGLGLNVGNLDGDIYINFAINSGMELAAYTLCILTLDRVGRKVLHAGTMLLGGVACLCTIFTVLYADESLNWLTVVLANVGKFGISAAFAVIYVWTAELFPTPVRNSGMGSSSMMARVGGMVCPYVADLGTVVSGDFGTALPLIIFGGLSVFAGLLSLLLPETKGKVLPETVEDAQNFGRESTAPLSKTKYYVNEAYSPEDSGSQQSDF